MVATQLCFIGRARFPIRKTDSPRGNNPGGALTDPKHPFVHYPGRMTETDADRFRQEADECRRLAEISPSQLDKEAWLRLAADWIRLAENAEQRRSRWLRE